MTEASEFDKVYKVGVEPIPTDPAMVRAGQSDVIYKARRPVQRRRRGHRRAHQKGQPVLVGTVSA